MVESPRGQIVLPWEHMGPKKRTVGPRNFASHAVSLGILTDPYPRTRRGGAKQDSDARMDSLSPLLAYMSVYVVPLDLFLWT